ncbi:MAG: hypothetical protein HY255_12025 [Betaproteobacteria bacterium]|nr:hypothetical protein [Betaproteobacteria bacterium]
MPAMLDVKFDPNSTNNALASGVDGYVYFSRDAGATWQPSIQLLAPTLTLQPRAELAYSKATPGMAYVSLDHSSGELWRTTDGGQTWALVSNPAHLGTQGSYANTIWVDPVNDANIVVGGLDLYRSIDSGASFIKISTWQFAGPGLTQPHADHHTIVAAPDYSPANQVVYFGNDGGLYRSTNILTADANTTSSWVNLNNSLGVTQFYGGAGKRSAGGMVIGGTQDNGTIYQVSGTNWDRFAGGDGGFVAVDPVSDNTLYGEYVYASIHRTIGLGSRQYICSGITEGKKSEGGNTYCGANATEQTNFISPFILDPNDRNRMLVGAASLWVTTNVQATPPTWTSIKSPITLAGNSRPYINAIAVQESNSNVIWVGVNGATSTGGQGGYVYKTINGLAVAPTWQLVSTSNLPTSTVTRITIDPTNPNRVWVVYSGFSTNRLWETTDGGTSWHSLTSNLPAITLYDIKRHPTQSNWLYVGAANGVYTSQDGGATWSTTTDGPSGVRVRELFWYDSQTLIAATFGRGMFLATAAAPTGPPLPPSKRGGIDFDGQGKSQLVIRNGNGQMQAGRFANSTFTFTPIGDPGSGYRILGTSDLNWNGKSDLLFQDTATPGDFGDASTWLDFDSNQQRLVRSVKRVWDVQAVGDLDGDGFGDLVWRYVVADSPDTGVSYIWFTAGAPNTSGPNVTQVRKRGGAPLDWRLLGALDLNNDGAADMLYLSPANQLKALMATPNRTCANLSAGTVPSGFTVLKFADFTGNQRGDVLIRDAAGNTKLLSLNANGLTLPPYAGAPDDQNASCTASSLVVVSTTINLPVADPTWTYYASGDFDGDGIFDVVWRLPNGSLTVWLMKANGVPAVVSNAGTVPAGFAPIPLQ